MKHVKVDSQEGLFPPQDLSMAGAGMGLFVQFPYSGKGINKIRFTPQKELHMISTRGTRSKSLARQNVACLSQFIPYFSSTSSNTRGKRRDTDYYLE